MTKKNQPEEPSKPLNLDSVRLLAFDPSSSCVGWALFEGARLAAYGKFDPVGDAHGEKLSSFLAFLVSSFHQYQPDEIAIEVPWSGRRRYVFGVLMQYLGIILLSYFETFGEELPKSSRLQPRTVKTALDIDMSKKHKHTVNKQMMVDRINLLYQLSLDFDDNDIADAIAVGHAWRFRRAVELGAIAARPRKPRKPRVKKRKV